MQEGEEREHSSTLQRSNTKPLPGSLSTTATEIELALIRLYRADEAHASVAEQYAHYRTLLRDELGLEAPPLDSL